MGEEEDQRLHSRPSLKAHVSFNNYSKWKDKGPGGSVPVALEVEIPDIKDDFIHHQDIIKSTFQDIVSDELRKIKDTSLDDALPNHDEIWEYDGLHTAYRGDCEDMLLEMQRIFYEDLRMEESRKESEMFIRTWDDEEDEYLSRAVYEHMQLNNEQEQKEVWCPICKQGELQENFRLIYCSFCQLKLDRDDEINLALMRNRLAEAHTEHLDRGCRLRPEFCIESRFQLTALYIKCQDCSTFEVVV